MSWSDVVWSCSCKLAETENNFDAHTDIYVSWRVFAHVHPKEQENTFISGIVLLELEGSFHLFCHVLCAFISDMSNSACLPLPLKDYFSDIF